MSGAEIRAHAGKLHAAGQKITPLVVDATTKATLDTARDSREGAPVDTGYLRASHAVATGSSGTSVWGEVTVGAEYAPYVENGTSRMAPQPFHGPAFEANSAKWQEAMSQLGGKAVQ